MNRRALLVRVAIAAVVVGAVAAWALWPRGDSGSKAGKGATHSTLHGQAVPTGTPQAKCAPVVLGEVLDAKQAVVVFDATQVCHAYVTVAVGTPVTWRNDGKDAVMMSLFREYPQGDPLPQADTTYSIGAGSKTARGFTEPATWYFTLSSLGGFVGTVEIVAS